MEGTNEKENKFSVINNLCYLSLTRDFIEFPIFHFIVLSTCLGLKSTPVAVITVEQIFFCKKAYRQGERVNSKQNGLLWLL